MEVSMFLGIIFSLHLYISVNTDSKKISIFHKITDILYNQKQQLQNV
jgi:hypothetical protein